MKATRTVAASQTDIFQSTQSTTTPLIDILFLAVVVKVAEVGALLLQDASGHCTGDYRALIQTDLSICKFGRWQRWLWIGSRCRVSCFSP